MFGIKNFSPPRSSFQRPVPLVFVSPDDTPDHTVCFNRAWLPYVLGSLSQLMLQSTWNTDDPEVLANQISRANILRSLFIDGCTPEEQVAIEEMEYLMAVCEQLRFQNGKLQGLCCGEWVDIGGQPAQGFAPAGIGTGTTPPAAGGGCADYIATMVGNGYFYAPFLVNTGDTILVSNIKGATYNPANGAWYLLNGHQFFAGLDVGSPITAGGNPVPAQPSGKLVAKIGATFYDVYNGTFTVPGGIANQPIQFQVNYASIASSAGDVSFTVTLCNNSVATWSHTDDFTLSGWGYSTFTDSSITTATGIWLPGVGWSAQTRTQSGTGHRTAIYIQSPHASFVAQSVDVRYAFTAGQVVLSGDKVLEIQSGAGGLDAFTPVPDTSDAIHTFTGPFTLNPAVFYLDAARQNGADPSPLGSAVIISITYHGTGVNPF